MLVECEATARVLLEACGRWHWQEHSRHGRWLAQAFNSQHGFDSRWGEPGPATGIEVTFTPGCRLMVMPLELGDVYAPTFFMVTV